MAFSSKPEATKTEHAFPRKAQRTLNDWRCCWWRCCLIARHAPSLELELCACVKTVKCTRYQVVAPSGFCSWVESRILCRAYRMPQLRAAATHHRSYEQRPHITHFKCVVYVRSYPVQVELGTRIRPTTSNKSGHIACQNLVGKCVEDKS